MPPFTHVPCTGPSDAVAERIAQMAEFLPESLWLVDVASRQVIYANPAYEKVWGASRESLYQDRHDWLQQVHPEEQQRLRDAIRRRPHGGLDIRFRILTEREEVRWLHMKSFAIGDGPRPHTIGGIAFDVSDVLAAEARAHHLTHFDGLTGLPNRNQFREQLVEALRHAERRQSQAALLCLGLDGFQSVNENLGYRIGDAALAQLAQRLRRDLRGGDLLGRLGGDLFGLLLTDESGLDISQAARRLIDLTATSLEVEGSDVYLGASLGIAVYPSDGTSADQLLYRAETALHDAKQHGGGTFRFFEAAANERLRSRQQTEQALRLAVQENQFVLHYQPKVSCSNGTIIGAEALIRWQHPQHGLISPAEFIQAMEESGQVVAVGRWVMHQACLQASRWHARGLGPFSVAVNLSARQLREGNLVQQVRQVLEETGLAARWLELELTESMLMEDVEETIATLGELRALGVRLSVDDFGTGYSSLSYLKRFPLDAVKVDRSFVQDIVADPNDVSITRAVITMAHALQMKVIAEGVETEAQLALLIANRCDEIQGYYFSRPVPAEEMEIMLENGKTIPEDLIHPRERKRTLLLVDDEENILSAMKRLLRKEGYDIRIASGGEEGLKLLAEHPVDVIISDQRMPGMTGVEFLRRAKVLHPESIRIVLSGYTELQSVTSAINEGAIYKFLIKPWDDEQLKEHIAEAFHQKELADENRRLSSAVQLANRELESANGRLQQLLEEREQRINRNETALDVLHEVLEILPWPLLGVDDEGIIVTMNGQAENLLGSQGGLLGEPLDSVLPPATCDLLLRQGVKETPLQLRERTFLARSHSLGLASAGRGLAITLMPTSPS